MIDKNDTKFYVYKWVSIDDVVLYVGKTKNINNRTTQHEDEKTWITNKTLLYYAELQNKTDMDIYEIYYINKYEPKHNTNYMNNSKPSFILSELDFKLFNRRSRKFRVSKKQKKLVEFDAIIRKNKGVVRAMELEFNERAVYRELCDLCFSKDNVVCIGTGIPTLDELSEYIGLKSRTLSKHLISLEEKGLICRKNFSHKKMIYINPIYYTTHLNFDQLSDEVRTVFGDDIGKYEIEEL